MKYSLLMLLLVSVAGCGPDGADADTRTDGAYRLDMDLTGSLQNPAFCPDGSSIVFTRFRDGYNEGVSDLFIYNLETEQLSTLLSDDVGHVNLPGSSWNEAIHSVVFASSIDPHDEIFLISDTGQSGEQVQVTDRKDKQSFEPTFSPDGQWIVFESHDIDVEGEGLITKFKVDKGSGYIDLSTQGDDCRQPNWSPVGDRILYQKKQGAKWGIWTVDTDGQDAVMVTDPLQSATDAVFSFDGQWIIYSGENGDAAISNIYKVPADGGHAVQITEFRGYDGAPSISPDGDVLAFESSDDDPDGSEGTSIWVKELE